MPTLLVTLVPVSNGVNGVAKCKSVGPFINPRVARDYGKKMLRLVDADMTTMEIEEPETMEHAPEIPPGALLLRFRREHGELPGFAGPCVDEYGPFLIVKSNVLAGLRTFLTPKEYIHAIKFARDSMRLSLKAARDTVIVLAQRGYIARELIQRPDSNDIPKPLNTVWVSDSIGRNTIMHGTSSL